MNDKTRIISYYLYKINIIDTDDPVFFMASMDAPAPTLHFCCNIRHFHFHRDLIDGIPILSWFETSPVSRGGYNGC